MSSQDYHQPSIYAVFFVQFFVGLFFIIALLNRQRDLAFLTLIVLSVMTAARLWCRASLRGLSVSTGVERSKLFPGDHLRVSVWAKNKKWLPVRLQTDVFVEGDPQVIENTSDLRSECGLLWYQRADFQWKRRVCRRGVFQLGPTHITAGDFFGFFLSAKRMQRSPIEIVVYPRIVPLKPFPLPRKDFFGLPGAKSPVQDPIYILGTRDYQHWQPARYIHWKASARRDRLQEKVFEPSAQAKILLLVDVASFAEHQAADDFERSLEVLASLAVQCDRNGYALGFSTNGSVHGGTARCTVSHGHQKLSAILEIVARLQMKALGPLSEALRNDRVMHWGVSVVCFSYQDNSEIQAVQAVFEQRKIPMTAVVCHGQGNRPSGGRRTIVLDALAIEATSP